MRDALHKAAAWEAHLTACSTNGTRAMMTEFKFAVDSASTFEVIFRLAGSPYATFACSGEYVCSATRQQYREGNGSMCGLLSQACKLLRVSPERMQNDLVEFLEPVLMLKLVEGALLA